MLPRRRVLPRPHTPRRASVPLRVAPPTLVALGLVLGALPAAAQQRYFPPAGAWETRRPEQVGMNAAKLDEAVAFARERASGTTADLEQAHYGSFGREPFGDAVGPFKERGPVSGIIVRGGYIVAEFGEPDRVDMTFSVTKSFLSTTVGLAYDRGLIPDVNRPVHLDMAPVIAANPATIAAEGGRGPLGAGRPIELFDSPHNRTITWDHLLRQVSDWEGTLWGKPEWADRPDRDPSTWLTRERRVPGSAYEYNDTRVNVLALAALNVWRRPLPEVLREYLMDPIGASPTWRWYGYDNSWVVIDGQLMQSVSGGGHWGGGMFISARDQARFGLLATRDGRWGDRQVLSEEWLRMARTPTPAEPGYGFMNFFLNTGRERMPSAPETAFVYLGNGTNMVYCDPDNDVVIVARWIQGGAVAGIVERVLAAIEAPVPAGQR
jgi:CubicO group peptidase (beta-lactamase class C family)